MSLRKLLRLALVVFLLFPFLFLLTQFRPQELPDMAELWWAFKNTFIQALLSSVCSLFLGIWASFGILNFPPGKSRLRLVLEVACLVPNFLPPLFILLSVLNIVDPFPMGVLGIALVHTVMNFGLVAVLFTSIVESKVGGVAELSYVEGAGRWQFISKGLLPMLKKDLWLLGLFIFVVCFGSFSVPLIVGGGKGTTIEVLIYEKIRLSSDWGGAVFLAALQSLFIFGLSLIVGRGKGSTATRYANLSLLRTRTGIAIIVAISLMYLTGYVQGLIAGFGMMSTLYEYQSALAWSFVGSILIGMTVGIFCYAGLMLIAFCWPKPWFDKFLNGYVAPSTSLACFCLLILSPNEGIFPFIKIPVALVLLSLNGLFRMGWDSELRSLDSQLNVAYAMGASPVLIFKEVMFPQISAKAGVLAGIGAVWACGDFAVSRILAHRDLSIAMMTETLMSSYRLNQATVLSLLIIVAGIICFALCVGGSRVLRRKFTP
ncbi:ABC transporter permease subunit [Bdellovibrio sp. KM01]|uniref:ABC transporter permease subunit n=1 Tax=Bdellovibrio sp. KM01 TaxID=2748865 RepID=UPI0015EAD17E|nr:ABC transporter permease subunit [Bdellovibrio sp. KM01]QLY25965.1 ABC transporter permease subunit [Bdellovibrio sp. KM01]